MSDDYDFEPVITALQPKLEAVVHQFCDEAYASIMETVQDHLAENAKFNVASRLASAERGRQYLRKALTAILDLRHKPYQLCDEHRDPIWNREKHESHEAKAIGRRAKMIASDALQGSWNPEPASPAPSQHPNNASHDPAGRVGGNGEQA